MKLAWIKWGGYGSVTETRDDGYVIYHCVGYVKLKRPGKDKLDTFRSAEQAKKAVEEMK